VKYCCCTPRRLQAVTEGGVLNGISFLEVNDTDAPAQALRQRTLVVHLLKAPGAAVTGFDIVIDGGVRYPSVGVLWVTAGDALPAGESPALLAGVDDPSRVLVVRTDGTGDYSRYTLRIVAHGAATAPTGFDPQLATVDFSFKVECPSDFDCRQDCFCPPTPAVLPPINYLAKDFDSLRQLMLDRISLLAPGSVDSRTADLGVALVEVLAHVGDRLSYRQDAIATEAYLGTARSRISLRRHARLVDYRIGEGRNAQVYVQVTVAGSGVPLPAGTPLLTAAPPLPDRVDIGDPRLQPLYDAGAVEVFETTADALLDADVAELSFWTWGELDCCLSIGATSATLLGPHRTLRVGDVLILAEKLSPTTGTSADADLTHRAAVRLTNVVVGEDPSGGRFADPPTNDPVEITAITWDPADALAFPLCVSALTKAGGQLQVGVAWGNIVLADHGRTLDPQTLGPVPTPALHFAPKQGCGCTTSADDAVTTATDDAVPVRFRPTLAQRPLTFAAVPDVPVLFTSPATPGLITDIASLDFDKIRAWLEGHGYSFSATGAVVQGLPGDWSVSDGTTVLRLTHRENDIVVTGRRAPAGLLGAGSAPAAPALKVIEPSTGGTKTSWDVLPDLLESGATSPDLVVEIDTDGTAVLRFGDGTRGLRPTVGATFEATYRIGNGAVGNVAATAIAHLVSDDKNLKSVTNPMAAAGGVEPETPLAIRRDAPQAYLVQERAVTESDYADMAARTPGVAHAVATQRWTGSWYTVYVTADREGGAAVDDDFAATVVDDLEAYRMAGYDVDVVGPTLVALKIELFVCVLAPYLRADVHQALLVRLGSHVGPDGVRGLFHPDNFTFGQPVYLSVVVAAAQEVPGVQSVAVTTFARAVDDAGTGLITGQLPMGRTELAQCANDPNFPDHGVLSVTLGGGR
jgi:hypothetical protein